MVKCLRLCVDFLLVLLIRVTLNTSGSQILKKVPRYFCAHAPMPFFWYCGETEKPNKVSRKKTKKCQ